MNEKKHIFYVILVMGQYLLRFTYDLSYILTIEKQQTHQHLLILVNLGLEILYWEQFCCALCIL